MIWFKGLGCLPLAFAAAALGTASAMGAGEIGRGVLLCLAATANLIAGLGLHALGRRDYRARLDAGQDEASLAGPPEHSLYSIRMELWSVVMLALGVMMIAHGFRFST